VPKGTGYRNKNAYLEKAFEEFFRIAQNRLEAVNSSLGGIEIPTPPEPKRKKTPIPPALRPSLGD
jgi:hypothetical protein